MLVPSTWRGERSLIVVRSHLPIKHLHERKNDGCASVYSPVQQNGVKTETFLPQNDRATELDVNLLLAATVFHGIPGQYPFCLVINGRKIFVDG